MQTLVYIIGGYCLIKAVALEYTALKADFMGTEDGISVATAYSAAAFLFLAAIEAFNQ